MKMVRLLTVAACAWALNACTPQIHTDYTTQHNFDQYRHFMWLDATPNSDTYEAFGGDIFEARLQRAVDASLTTKGYSAETPADFLVSYHLDEEARAQVRHSAPMSPSPFYFRGLYPYGYGYGASFQSHSQTDDIRYYSIGILTIKIIDADSQKTVWSATRKVSLKPSKNPAEADATLNASVAEMLALFPPHTATTL